MLGVLGGMLRCLPSNSQLSTTLAVILVRYWTKRPYVHASGRSISTSK